MDKYRNVPVSNHMVQEIDSRRGRIKRSTYLQALLSTAWEKNLEIDSNFRIKRGKYISKDGSEK